MRISIHQPEHLPWMGFFSKMAASDLMVFLDDVQFEKNYFQNRNRVVDPAGRCHWLTLSCDFVDGHLTLIKDVGLKPLDEWMPSYFGKLRHSLSQDEHYGEITEWLKEEFETHSLLSSLNISLISAVARSLGVRTESTLASNLQLSSTRSERLIEILKACSATEYLIGKGSLGYLDMDLFKKNQIDVFLVEAEPERNLSVSGEPLSCLQELTRKGFGGLDKPRFVLRRVSS